MGSADIATIKANLEEIFRKLKDIEDFMKESSKEIDALNRQTTALEIKTSSIAGLNMILTAIGSAIAAYLGISSK